ncbi:YciI family protein [Embleya sp. NPDC020630]|uniref:YciI family protein n=1 Tax=Embleya sp. NPDC020630 TaxID=3363979 RepID=UPI0037B5706A
MTDGGPFLDVKQPMGGFYLVECADKERAIELAAQLPDVGIEGGFRRRGTGGAVLRRPVSDLTAPDRTGRVVVAVRSSIDCPEFP